MTSVWDAFPRGCLLLDPDLGILGVNTRYSAATLTRPDDIIGRHMFDVFPDNPAHDGSKSAETLRASLERVASQRVPDTMPLTRYDVRDRAGVFVERYWSASNDPVLDPRSGDLLYLLHSVTDETERVLSAAAPKAADEQTIAAKAEDLDPSHVRFEEDPLSAAIETHFNSLSARERVVMKFAIEGKANKVIAFYLGISPRTVEVYRSNILKKTFKGNFLELSRALLDLSASK